LCLLLLIAHLLLWLFYNVWPLWAHVFLLLLSFLSLSKFAFRGFKNLILFFGFAGVTFLSYFSAWPFFAWNLDSGLFLFTPLLHLACHLLSIWQNKNYSMQKSSIDIIK
jgi:hypothetical protein